VGWWTSATARVRIGLGWQPLPPADWAARHRHLAAGQRWVLDGNYASTLGPRLERAGTIIFLDLPPPANRQPAPVMPWPNSSVDSGLALIPSDQRYLVGSTLGAWLPASS